MADAFQQLVRDRRGASPEKRASSQRNFVAPWWIFRPYGWKRLAWETLGVLLMLTQVVAMVGWYGEANAQRHHYERCMAGQPGFSTAAEREAAMSPRLLEPPLTGLSRRGARWYHLDVASGIAAGEFVERPPPTTMRGLLNQQIRRQLQRGRRLRCEPIYKAVSPLTAVKERRCGAMCWLADGLQVAVDAYDLLNFLLLFLTAYQYTARGGDDAQGEEEEAYEFGPRRIAAFRLTRWYLPFQLLVATPSYYLASRGGLLAALVASLRGSLLDGIASHPWDTLRLALTTGVAQSALKVVQLVRVVMKVVTVLLRLLRLRALLQKLRRLWDALRRRARLSQRVKGVWRRVRLAHTDGLGLASRVGESPSKKKPGVWTEAPGHSSMYVQFEAPDL